MSECWREGVHGLGRLGRADELGNLAGQVLVDHSARAHELAGALLKQREGLLQGFGFSHGSGGDALLLTLCRLVGLELASGGKLHLILTNKRDFPRRAPVADGRLIDTQRSRSLDLGAVVGNDFFGLHSPIMCRPICVWQSFFSWRV